MKTRILAAFVGLGLAIAILVLMLIIPSFIMADLTFYTLPFVSSMIIESEQYEPVISFKKKYPDYTVIVPEQPNPENAKIIYQHQNASLNRIEVLSISITDDDGIFASLQCGDFEKIGSGGRSFVLRYYTDGDVDDFKCADYSVDSDTLQRLHNAKASLEQSDIPIDTVKINYETNSLYVTVFNSSKKINDEKINEILLAERIPASVAYHSGEYDSWNSDGDK